MADEADDVDVADMDNSGNGEEPGNEDAAGSGSGNGSGSDSGSGSGSGSEDDSDEESDRPMTPPQRPVRTTRGKRMRQLVGEEAEADELFWGQKAFVDEANADDEYSVSSCT